MKNIQAIVDTTAYEAFQVVAQNKSDQISVYYRRGTSHTAGGGLYYRTFTGLDTPTISSPTAIIPYTTENISGVSGGQMDDSNTVIFYVVNHSDGTRDIWITKADVDNNFTMPVLFDWTGITKLTAGYFYGTMIKGDTAGEYYHIMYQTATSRYRISVVKTTDYWATYSEVGVIYDGTSPFTETSGVNLGSGKFVAITRVNNSGGLRTFESTNYGVSWIARGASNLFWWNGGGPSIPSTYYHDGVFDVFYECRDTSMMHISKGNTLASNFGNSTPVYNVPEIYSYHKGTGGNPSLGYGSQIKLSSGKYFMIYSKEYTNSRANLQWVIDDLVTDGSTTTTTIDNNPTGTITVSSPASGTGISYSVDGVDYTNTTGVFSLSLGSYGVTAKVVTGTPALPTAPTLTISGVTATSFRYDITGYSDADWQGVRYLSMDLSTSSDFSTFVTAKYRSISAYPAVSINNIRVTGYWDTFNVLTTGTTYYFRIKACNNEGCSAYTTQTVATL